MRDPPRLMPERSGAHCPRLARGVEEMHGIFMGSSLGEMVEQIRNRPGEMLFENCIHVSGRHHRTLLR